MNEKLALDWKAEYLRITFFLGNSPERNIESNFIAVFDSEPITTTKNNITNESICEGTFSNYRAFTKTQNNSIEFAIVKPEATGESVYIENPKIILSELITKALSNEYIQEADINRIGLGGNYLSQVSKKEDGYLYLNELLHPIIKLDPTIHSDFRLKINQKTTSNVLKDLEINRLMQWAAVYTELSNIVQNEIINYPRKFYCNALSDINTSFKHTDKFSSDEKIAITSELNDLNSQILGIKNA